MASRKDRITQGAHIKRNTQGTSNEISFSVLHAALNSADEENPLQREDPFWAQASEEVSRRKRVRRHRRLRLTGALALVGVALVGLAAWGIAAGLEAAHQLQGELAVAVEEVQRADETVLPFDELVVRAMTEPVDQLADGTLASSYEEMAPALEQAQKDLAKARSDVEAIQPELRSPRDIEAANQLLVAISARTNLLAAGQEALDEALLMVGAYGDADQAWELLLSADGLAREAASVAGQPGEEAQRASLAKSQEALAAFAEARDLFEEAAGLVPEVDLQPYVDYANARINAQAQAQASAQAMLDRDPAAAVEANDRYNALEAEAAASMRAIEQEPASLEGALFYSQREELFSSYLQERQRAATADAFLTDYVGSLRK